MKSEGLSTSKINKFQNITRYQHHSHQRLNSSGISAFVPNKIWFLPPPPWRDTKNRNAKSSNPKKSWQRRSRSSRRVEGSRGPCRCFSTGDAGSAPPIAQSHSILRVPMTSLLHHQHRVESFGFNVFVHRCRVLFHLGFVMIRAFERFT